MKFAFIVSALLSTAACGDDVRLGSVTQEALEPADTRSSVGEAVQSDDVAVKTDAVEVKAAPDFTTPITWHYQDFIGHFLEREARVDGSLSVTFLGDLLPLAGETTKLRAARVVLEIPSFENPDRLLTREFLVHFQTTDEGQSFTASPANYQEERSSIIDAFLKNAAALFATTYDPERQLAFARQAFRKDVSSVTLKLTSAQGGGLVADSLRVSAPRTVRQDFAFHSTTISFELQE